MDKWKMLRKYCQQKINQAVGICPRFSEPGRNQLRDECCYMVKYYHDVLLRMEEFEGVES